MRISEMTTDQATEAMVRISAAFGTICEDEEMLKMIDALNGIKWKDAIRGIIPKFVMTALKNHKMELYDIVGALNCVPASDVGAYKIVDTIAIVRNSWDDVMTSFFPSSGIPPQETVEKSVQ